MAKKAKDPTTEEEIVPVEEPVREELAVVPLKDPKYAPEPLPEPEQASTSAATSPTFGQRVGRFLNFLARLLFVLIILTLVSVGLYYLLPRLYQQYILPVQENTNQLEQLRDQQSQSAQSISALETRLAEIESVQAEQAETLAAFESRLGDVEIEIAAHTETLALLEQMQAELQSQTNAASMELGRQIQLLKAMELLSRARLFMYQSNFGLARQDVRTARGLLATIQPEAPESLADDLSAVILRLDLTLTNLPNFPVAASDDLDIAWQILLGGLPQDLPVSAETSLPIATFTLTPGVTITPTADLTVTATSTP